MISAHGSWATAYRHTNTPAPGHKSPAATRVRSSGLVAAIANNNALAIMNADEAVEQYMQAVDVVGDVYHLSPNASDVDKSGSEDHPVPGLVVEEAAVQANTTQATPVLDCSEVLRHIDVPEVQDQQEASAVYSDILDGTAPDTFNFYGSYGTPPSCTPPPAHHPPAPALPAQPQPA